MISYFILAFKKYAEFNGRSSRSEYWYFFLTYLIIGIVFGALSMVREIFSVLYILFALVSFIPSLAVAVRRLHDTGKSGWNILLGLIPFVGIIILLVYLASEGKPGPNEYGPNPNEKEGAVPVQSSIPTGETPQAPVQ